MSPSERSPDPTNEPLRPSSVWTNDSVFADSAISMGSRSNTPKQLDDEHLELRSPTSPKHNLSERLSQLAAIAWAAEQDGYVDDHTKEKVFEATKTIESCLDECDEDEELSVQGDSARGAQEAEVAAIRNRELEQTQLQYIHEQLAATVTSMRLRQQEQRHINELAIRKMEDIASTCAGHEQTIRALQNEVEQLRIDKQKLERDNSGFQTHAMQLTSELEQKDLAVQAMSSAVAGLDGWIQTSLGPDRPATRRVRATRGRGRFQTHYYVDVPVEGPMDGRDGTIDAREVRDGITAWVRGFRDVEDAMNTGVQSRSSAVYRHPTSEGGLPMNSRMSSVTEDDDWGDFQTASSARFD
ncbi:uncharacterized protein HMPREF1541_07295 [Cyphellophora europaea CBS 101466]|uniref:Uncharacterized protein n=1 Tax=Cyphellophora europaea (strain CBS 101466) TaxID=1220924 RepID=W2RMF9_CYPE1|nr:uncharacterized protein HMPREF1541_07295 [Cyphellophora europaea CBS 101466]ETN37672.1 hypothetical protein HMPREF1541_07295 [Cyphellophora europaea CBS 101466]